MLAASPLDLLTLRSSEDAFIEQLLASAPTHGAPLLAARLPRAWVDLNRATDDLDPALIEGVRSHRLDPRVASGLGVIPRVVAAGRAIYCAKISRAEAEARIDAVWRPYHARLGTLIAEAHAAFGMALLLDVHSMPHEVVASLPRPAPQVVLGDRYGASAAPALVAAVDGRRLPPRVCAWRATRPLPAPISRRLMAARDLAAMWYRSKSTALSIWTKRGLSLAPGLTPLRR